MIQLLSRHSWQANHLNGMMRPYIERLQRELNHPRLIMIVYYWT
jgi:hypothetical protein